MIERLSIVPLIVKDLDDAVEFYTKKLGFEIVTDATMDPIHFLTVAPKLEETPRYYYSFRIPEF
jgi:catechol 2,3-dioxygenase-like lactoylglutathione lyase family enzyme